MGQFTRPGKPNAFNHLQFGDCDWSPMGTEGDGRQYTGQWVKNRMHGAPGNAFDVDNQIITSSTSEYV